MSIVFYKNDTNLVQVRNSKFSNNTGFGAISLLAVHLDSNVHLFNNVTAINNIIPSSPIMQFTKVNTFLENCNIANNKATEILNSLGLITLLHM